MIKTFAEALRTQRWDDHRYYHHSRINQTLHFVSAMSFLCAYMMLFFYPVAAALIGWLIAMTTRQVGHFFFEPKGFDDVNQVTHEYKEEIKVGYNLRRKIVLLAIWRPHPLEERHDAMAGLAPRRPVEHAGPRRGSSWRPRCRSPASRSAACCPRPVGSRPADRAGRGPGCPAPCPRSHPPRAS